jgi:hypothetical protein
MSASVSLREDGIGPSAPRLATVPDGMVAPDGMVPLPGGRFRMRSDRHYREEAPPRPVGLRNVANWWAYVVAKMQRSFEATAQ